MVDIKNNRVQISLSDYERKRLERLASNWGVSLAGAVRRLIREAEDGGYFNEEGKASFGRSR